MAGCFALVQVYLQYLHLGCFPFHLLSSSFQLFCSSICLPRLVLHLPCPSSMVARTGWTSLLTPAAFMILGFPDPTFVFSGSSMSTSTAVVSFSIIWSRTKSAVVFFSLFKVESIRFPWVPEKYTIHPGRARSTMASQLTGRGRLVSPRHTARDWL